MSELRRDLKIPDDDELLFPASLIGWNTFINCHNEGMAMTSLNISLPEPLKQYVEGQVASGDWGTPSEYIRELIRQDKKRRLHSLEQDLIAAAKGPKIELTVNEIRKKGLIATLRAQTARQSKVTILQTNGVGDFK